MKGIVKYVKWTLRQIISQECCCACLHSYQYLIAYIHGLFQVYHHFSMPLYAWIQMTWTPGGHHTLGGIFNCCVHIIMYRFDSRGPSVFLNYFSLFRSQFINFCSLKYIIFAHFAATTFLRQWGHNTESTCGGSATWPGFRCVRMLYYIE